MRLTRLFVPVALAAGGSIELPADTAAHIVRVLRARSGDPLILFNGEGCEYPGTIDSVRGNRVSVALGAEHAVDRESALAVTLVQAIPRGDRMDFVVQKATELGVARIVPTLSERSVVRLDERQQDSKLAHWRAVAISACEQCGRNRLPRIEPPRDLRKHLAAPSDATARFVLEPKCANLPFPATPPIAVEVTVGPEGGFSSAELDAMGLAGLSALRLGPRILRTETAALAALTWLQTRFGDMNPAIPC
ncbi:MAG: 16S rRNA (uracil(1498)-N(3))-methyltransferase [Proteobacteria bacterium]|nr:16S rRNA (uracil(1498)-N(3))-methyltransferase [Pseudomonadota bacterium]